MDIASIKNSKSSSQGNVGDEIDQLSVDQSSWQKLAEAHDSEAFFSAWLALQCKEIGAVRAGLVLAETQAEKTFAPAAIWPATQGVSEALVDVARSALDEGDAIVVDLHREYAPQLDVKEDSIALAFPLTIQENIVCIAALEIGNKQQQDIQAVMRQLQWGASWLEAFFLRDQSDDDEATIDRLVTALYMTAIISKEKTAKQAVTTFVTELAARLDCERVSCGFLKGKHVKVTSVSHTGQFGKQMNLINAIGKAMDESLEQNSAINYPEPSGNGVITHHHENLSRQQNGGAILTVPLVWDDKNIGAVCIESTNAQAFDQQTVQLCDSIATVSAPIIHEKGLNDRWILTKLKDSFVTQLKRLFGKNYLGRKFFTLLMIGVAAGLYYGKGEFKITADAVLEGAEQRVLVTPYDGFVESSIRRVGDSVKQGELIATLDDTDLSLDLVELTSGRAQAQSQYNEAVAEHNRAKVKILNAKIAQADARVELVKEKLKRTRLVSPLDGIIVKGDLSQSLGAAVSRGEPLFEIATLNQYRVNLMVDERDIAHIQPGQDVNLILASLPNEKISVKIKAIMPVTRAAQGRNFFNVEAMLDDERSLLRPGMEGVAKIAIDEQRYLWIWTREMVNWFKLWFWRWMD